MTIEEAETRDGEELADLWISLADSQREYGSHILSSENRTAIRESIARHVVSDTLLVARDGDIVGFVMFTVDTGTFEHAETRGIIENLYVVEDRRNEGIGSALLARAEEALSERDVDAVALEVMADNERARNFYRRHGYTPHRIELQKQLESDTPSKDDR